MFISLLVFIVALVVPQWNEPIYIAGVLHGPSIFLHNEFYRFITSIFMHSGAMHIAMNLLSLYLLGRVAEKLFKPLVYISIYFVTALFGSTVYLMISPEGQAIGASGAIFGIFGALAGFAWIHRKNMQGEFMEFMRSFGMILLLNFAIAMAVPQIAMSAHIGGLVAGIISGLVMARYPRYLWAYLLVSAFLIYLSFNYLSSLYETSLLLY